MCNIGGRLVLVFVAPGPEAEIVGELWRYGALWEGLGLHLHLPEAEYFCTPDILRVQFCTLMF